MVNHGQMSFEVFLESVDTGNSLLPGILIATFSTTEIELTTAFSFLSEPLRTEVVKEAGASAKASDIVAKERYFFRLYNF